MTPRARIDAVLRQGGRRIRLQKGVRWAARGLCGAFAVSLAWLLAARMGVTADPSASALSGLLVAAPLAAGLLGGARPLRRAEVARLIDARAGLKERLTTAVWLGEAGSADAVARLQVTDAGEHAARLDLAAALPLRLPREAAVAVGLALALLGALYLPSVPLFWSAARKQERDEVRQAGAALARAAREVERAAAAGPLVESRRAAREARRLSEALRAGRIDKREAMVRTARLTKQVAEQQRRLAAAGAPAADRAADLPRGGGLGSLADAIARQDGAGQRRALEALGAQVRDGRMAPAQQARLAADLAKAAEALGGTELAAAAREMRVAAEGLKRAQLTPAQRQSIAQALQRAGTASEAGAASALDARTLARLAETIEANRLALARGGKQGRAVFGEARPASASGASAPRRSEGGSSASAGSPSATGRRGGFGDQPNRQSGRTPERLDPGRRPDAQVRGTGQPGRQAPAQQVRGGTATPGTAGVPEYDARVSARQAAESAVSRESIPPPVQRRVRDYFRRIAP